MNRATMNQAAAAPSSASRDVTMQADDSLDASESLTPDALRAPIGSFFSHGKELYDQLVGNKKHKDHVELAFLEILRHLSYIFDPWRPQSIASICLSPAGQRVLHQVPLARVLNGRSLSFIDTQRFAQLSQIFHNLSAKSEQQKAAFASGNILLNSWELLCFVLMNHIATVPVDECFYLVPANRKDKGKGSNSPGRLDDARLALVVLVKLLEHCQSKKGDASSGRSDLSRYCVNSEVLVCTMEEFFLIPSIFDSEGNDKS